jgi:hypothetical protein
MYLACSTDGLSGTWGRTNARPYAHLRLLEGRREW